MAKSIFKEIRNVARKNFSAEDMIRTVLEGLRTQISVSALAKRTGIAPSACHRWSKVLL